MIERNKVIEGLKRCIYDSDPGQLTKEFLSCSECPYLYGCTHNLMRDALTLIEEQRNRIKELLECANILSDALDEKGDADGEVHRR